MSSHDTPPPEVRPADLGAIASRAARRTPDGAAFVAAADGRTVTFGEFEARATACAAALRERGLDAGDRLAVLARNSVEMYVAHFGALKAGVVTLYLNADLTPSALAYQLRDARADAVVRDPELAPKLAAFEGDLDPTISTAPDEDGIVSVATLTETDRDPPAPRIDPDDPALILYTSGTTARPKGVVHSHRSYTYGVVNTLVGGDVRRDDVQTGVLPLFHIHQDLWTKAAFCVGATTVLYDAFEPDPFRRSLDRYDVTYVNLMASMYRRLLDAEAPIEAPSVRRCVHGMPMEMDVRERVADAFDADLQKVYGQTETLVTTFLDPRWQFEKPGNYVGEATPFADVALVDETGELCDRGETGEIVVRGPSVMEGYLNRPDASADAWSDGWHRTDDLGRFDEDGLLRFVDRKGDMIKTGGENVASIRVEECLLDHPAVAECAVVGLPHERWDEAVTAFVRIEGATTEADLLAHCEGTLAPFERPKTIVEVDSFPYTATGKIAKAELESAHRDLYD
jgi:long-chain acyl-CoA synthetase